MIRTIVLDEHTLGCVRGSYLEILRASVLRGSPLLGVQFPAPLHFDPILLEGRFRPATELDFMAFGVSFHSDYLTEGGDVCL